MADTIPDTVLVHDYLVFNFDKLSQGQIDSLKLYLVDENGKSLPGMKRTIIFSFIWGFIKMENMPENSDISCYGK